MDSQITIFQFKETQPGIYKSKKKIKLKDFPLENLFYTIGINYSLYSLNRIHLGEWLNSLFHKNDAYQTPIVIEPFRKDGNIDVNRQEDLVKSRLLANLLELEQEGDYNSFRKLTESLKAEKLILSVNNEKTAFLYRNDDGKEVTLLDEIENGKEILNAFFKKFNIPDSGFNNPSDIISHVKRYIIKKLISISVTYNHYKGYFKEDTLRFENIDNYLNHLYSDKSHITYKIRQTINFVKFNIIDYRKPIDISTLAALIDKTKSDNIGLFGEELSTIELIPPPFFRIEIKSSEGVTFEKLSSGEKQKIYSVNSILYHLKNVDSVSESNNDIIIYRNVNIILDEVELYFHPEMQRTYVSYLLSSINKMDWTTITGINICFITHSPFILSDIPQTNILFLEDNGQPATMNNLKTFGANVHELLIDGFFMKNTIGGFALEKINDIIKFHSDLNKCKTEKERLVLKEKYQKNKVLFYYVISNLGEEYLKKILENHILEIEKKLEDNSFINNEIQRLEKELGRLKQKQNA